LAQSRTLQVCGFISLESCGFISLDTVGFSELELLDEVLDDPAGACGVTH